jgi:hypothetical protein
VLFVGKGFVALRFRKTIPIAWTGRKDKENPRMTSVVDVLITAALVYAVLCVILGILVARHIVASMESPPFRRNVPNGPLSLDPVTIHPTWGSAVHDPLQDYGIPFKHVEFPAANPSFSLRGWLVDNRVRAKFRVKEWRSVSDLPW